MKTVPELSVLTLDGQGPLKFDAFTKFEKRKDVPVYMTLGGISGRLDELVALANFYRNKEGTHLMAELSWLPATPNYSYIENLYNTGHQIYANVYLRGAGYYNRLRPSAVELDRVELQTYNGGTTNLPAIFDW